MKIYKDVNIENLIEFLDFLYDSEPLMKISIVEIDSDGCTMGIVYADTTLYQIMHDEIDNPIWLNELKSYKVVDVRQDPENKEKLLIAVM